MEGQISLQRVDFGCREGLACPSDGAWRGDNEVIAAAKAENVQIAGPAKLRGQFFQLGKRELIIDLGDFARTLTSLVIFSQSSFQFEDRGGIARRILITDFGQDRFDIGDIGFAVAGESLVFVEIVIPVGQAEA